MQPDSQNFFSSVLKMKDEELWGCFIEGRSFAFEELYRRFYPLLKSYGLHLAGDGELVADVIQDLFVKLIRNCHRLHATDNVRCYLLCAFRRKLLDAFRDRHSFSVLPVENYVDFFHFDAEDASRLFKKDDECVEHERKLASALSRLSGRQREILYLYYVRGLSHSEISTLLSINVQSSKNLLSRTVLSLRKMFGL